MTKLQAGESWLGGSGDDDSHNDAEMVVNVWACNMVAVGVFQLCDIRGIGHMGGIHWQGIAPDEIRSACLLRRLPRGEWPQIADDVSFMGQVVANERNKQAARK